MRKQSVVSLLQTEKLCLYNTITLRGDLLCVTGWIWGSLDLLARCDKDTVGYLKRFFYGKNIFFLNVRTKFKFKMRPTWWFRINSQAAMKWINACVRVWSNAHILTSKLWKRISHLCLSFDHREGTTFRNSKTIFHVDVFLPLQKQLVWLDEIQPMQYAVSEVYQIKFPQ